MKCIDALEGTAKAILASFVDLATEYRLDASEYIRHVKTVIDGTVLFVTNNPEVGATPELIRGVLYDHAKMLWLARLQEAVVTETEECDFPDIDYQAYCYDYVYDHGNYPR